MKKKLKTYTNILVTSFFILGIQGCDDQLPVRLNKIDGRISALENELRQETNARKSIEYDLKQTQAKLTQENKEYHSGSKLTLQVGLAMTRLVIGTTKTGEEILGDSVAVKNTKVYLLKTSCIKLFEGKDGDYIAADHKDSLQVAWIRSLTPNAYAGPRSLALAAVKARSILEQNAVAVSFTDFTGKAEFSNVAPGNYIVTCATYLDAGAILEKNITQTYDDQYVNLSSDDVILDSKKQL